MSSYYSSSSSSNTVIVKSMSFPLLVFVIFLILKLAQIGLVASWSWVWVLSPLWIPIAIFASVGGLMMICAYIIRPIYEGFIRRKYLKQMMLEE